MFGYLFFCFFLPVSFNLILENQHKNILIMLIEIELIETLFMCANKSELILHQFFMFNEKNWC